MEYKVVYRDFRHYVCGRCGCYFACLDDLKEHLKVCDGLGEASSPSRSYKKKGRGWWYG